MTGGTSALAAIRIYPANPRVGPGSRINFSLLVNSNDGPMAMVTSDFAFIFRVHALVEPGVDFPHDFNCVGMFGAAVLRDFIRVTTGAVFRGDN